MIICYWNDLLRFRLDATTFTWHIIYNGIMICFKVLIFVLRCIAFSLKYFIIILWTGVALVQYQTILIREILFWREICLMEVVALLVRLRTQNSFFLEARSISLPHLFVVLLLSWHISHHLLILHAYMSLLLRLTILNWRKHLCFLDCLSLWCLWKVTVLAAVLLLLDST